MKKNKYTFIRKGKIIINLYIIFYFYFLFKTNIIFFKYKLNAFFIYYNYFNYYN